jgi:hypothetical protein
MPNNVAWIEVASADVHATGDFYRKLLNWPVVTDEKMNYTMTSFGPGETGIGLAEVNPEMGVTPGSVTIYADVVDIDATLRRARELGAPIYMDKTEIPTVGWIAIVGDPGGNRIGLMQSLPE